MTEPFDFRATINKKAMLCLYHGDSLLSEKKIEKPDQRGHFTFQGEKITWLCEVKKRTGKRGILYLYLYPINLNYTRNPIKVEVV